MANPEHLKILKQGVAAWYEWRQAHAGMTPDLERADLKGADLHWMNLTSVNLRSSDLSGTNLLLANLDGANLLLTDLSSADLRGANLHLATLDGASLKEANLNGAKLIGASLAGAHLRGANFGGADLENSDFRGTYIWRTEFGNNDLSTVKGLERACHDGPSTIGIDTIYKSKGNIPEVFLRGCGVPEDFITYMKSLVGKAIDFYSCFISYSSKDDDFAQRLHADLQRKGVRCWFAPEDLKIGDEFRTRIDESIRVYDKVMVVLSENSIPSGWVEKEVETAFEREQREKKLVLFPIRLDDAVMETNQAWAADVRRVRHIGDFRAWKDHDQYQKSFERLLRDLKA
jgi:uncharacterized protein YjbI with pentapeptide repeats